MSKRDRRKKYERAKEWDGSREQRQTVLKKITPRYTE